MTIAAIALAGATVLPAAADAPAPSNYRQAIQDTYDLVLSAAPDDTAAAGRALSVLEAGTGTTQPEVIADLQRKPPAFDDAKTRLFALMAEGKAVSPAADGRRPELPQRPNEPVAVPEHHQGRGQMPCGPSGRAKFDAGHLLWPQRHGRRSNPEAAGD